MRLNIAHACVTRDANGPGRRFTVWVQGCARGCPGCFNPGLQPSGPRLEVSAEELVRQAQSHREIDGVSLTGGEPFDQAEAVAEFLDLLRARAGRASSVVAFTGYTLEELRDGPAPASELLGRVDLLVDGPYLRGSKADLPLRGSANQRLWALTRAGEAMREMAERSDRAVSEVVITGEGEVILTGFPPQDLLRRLGAA